MKKITITIELEKDLEKEDVPHMLKAVVGFVQEDSFVEDLADSISCISCQSKLAIKKVDVQIKE